MTQRILIVCPEPARIQTLHRILVAAGYEVLHARTGDKALPQLCDRDVDLLVIDLDWPKDRDGESDDVFGRFYLLPPVIGITSRPGQFEHAAALGVDFLLEKPLNYGHLLGTIQTLLSQFARERRIDGDDLLPLPARFRPPPAPRRQPARAVSTPG